MTGDKKKVAKTSRYESVLKRFEKQEGLADLQGKLQHAEATWNDWLWEMKEWETK